MEKRAMEKLGIETSLLGFGCMRFPMTADGKIDEAEAERMLDQAYAAGVNYYDTAYPYHNGESERVVGRVMKKYDRGSFVLATKLPCWLIKNTDDIERIFEEQLEKLQTDYIDFYLMHALNKDSFQKMVDIGCVEKLEQLKAEGKIRYLGFSFHDKYEAFERIINYRDWDFCQIQLNYMDAGEREEFQQAGMKGYHLTEEKNVPLIIMEPVRGGSLAAFPEDITEVFHGLNPDASIASYALRWVGSLPNVKVILSGMSTMNQLTDNLRTFDKFEPLSEKETETIDKVVAMINSRMQNGCTACRYCMPCPAGVDIPRNFRIWNLYHMYGNYNAVKWDWEDGLGEEHKAKNCIKCGKCEKACPQKLSIRADLERVQADLDKKEFVIS